MLYPHLGRMALYQAVYDCSAHTETLQLGDYKYTVARLCTGKEYEPVVVECGGDSESPCRLHLYSGGSERIEGNAQR